MLHCYLVVRHVLSYTALVYNGTYLHIFEIRQKPSVNILIWGVLTHWGGGRGEWWRAFGRLRRKDGTASLERHVNKPVSLSKCWRKQRGTFWIVIRLITFCDLHPKKEMIYYGKRCKRHNFERQTTI